MRFLTITLIAFFILQLVSTQVVPVCSNDNHCNDLRTFNNRRCSSSTCQNFGEAAYKSTPTLEQTCKASFFFELILTRRCGSYAALDCVIPTGEIDLRRCIEGSRDGTGKCVASPTGTLPNYSQLNARCDTTTSPQELCPSDQQCLNKVCRKQLKVGEFCRGTGLNCLGGTTCDHGVCTLLYSLRDGDSCQSNNVCRSGSCSNGVCQPSPVTTCYSNSDCVSPAVCKKPSATSTTDEAGKCFNPYSVALSRYNLCTYTNCFSAGLTKDFQSNCETKCETDLIKLHCANNCPKRADQRVLTGSAYIYDCKALSRVPFTKGTDCEVVEQFKNCDAVIDYDASSTIKVSFWIVICFAIITLFNF